MKNLKKLFIFISFSILMIFFGITIFSVKSSTSIDGYNNGYATYYETSHQSNNWACELDPLPNELMVAALNTVDLDNFRLSGAYVEVTGTSGKSVVVRIVDNLPSQNIGDIDLSPEAFSAIADLNLGKIKVKWRIVSGDVSGPVKYHFSTGSDQWWAAIQIRNHRYPVETFEYKKPGGTFVEAKRNGRNYFQISNMGPGPFDFRITDIYGQQITDSGIKILNDSDEVGKSQFPVYSNHIIDSISPVITSQSPTKSTTPSKTPSTTISPTNNTNKPTISPRKSWLMGKTYKINDVVNYKGNLYKCIQSHTALKDWEPNLVPALWKKL